MKWKFWQRKPKEDKIKLYPSKNLAMVTTEADISFTPCKVTDDHKINFKFQKTKKDVRIMRNPHIIHFPLWALLPGRSWKLLLGRLLFPRYLRFLGYTVRREGEATHDPHDDKYDTGDKMRLEAMLKLEGKFAEAKAGEVIYEGMKPGKKWFDFIPYIIIAIICFLFLLPEIMAGF